ncbi:Lrp/AsnC family transcriptional regulator [Fodinibius halophilus]|uniref:Lrp/AsnC family transcriptional regulator n=1 Tax=Fodinibius halophilus TaxID=1736908 RepID=A0A6M1T4X8_9BACT|nr:Lrp/AsnC family transcriptional regulator [Fodinibius halophilus]NGP88305.1 Lrp/AsnC family transcriptional regulator [Fodinibius halophilus]
MAQGLDEIDIKILKHLQKHGRAQRNRLAEIVHLSVPSVSERMRKLEEKELITGYHAVLDSKRFKFDITAFVFVEVDGSENYPKFIEAATTEPEILECHSITGDGSHILKIRTENTASFENLLSQIQAWPGVSKSRSNVVLSSFKETAELPIENTFEPK